MPNQPRLASSALRQGCVGVALGLAATLATTVLGAAQADATTSHDPHGSFKVSVYGRHAAHVWGVATDPDSSAPERVVIAISGQKSRVVQTRVKNHAFGSWIWLPYGQHRVTVRALNRGAGRATVLGTRIVTVRNPANYNPTGTAYVTRYKQVVKFYGRAFDKSVPNGRLTMRLWHNGKRVYAAHTNRSGYYQLWSRLSKGANRFTVVAVNQGLGTTNTRIRHFTIAPSDAWIMKYSGNRRLAATLLASYHWGSDQMPFLDKIWTAESGWQTQAANPNGAYGIPQAYPGSKMAAAGADWRTNARTQIRWGLTYIQQRYGSPASAYYSRQQSGSY